MSSPTPSSPHPQPLAAPPSITAPSQRVLIPSSSSFPTEPPLVTPVEDHYNDTTMEDIANRVNVCGNKEKTGRWTDQEHLVFLDGLKVFGKQWKMIAGMIGTRTVVQVRTHAQKYFQKLERKASGTTGGTTNSSNGSGDQQGVAPTPPTNNNNHQQQPKRKSLPGSLPSRNNGNKKSRKGSAPRSVSLSLGPRNASSKTDVMATNYSMGELPSYPSYSSNSSSLSGSDNWSTVSPNCVTETVDLYAPHHQDKSALSAEQQIQVSDLDDLLGEDPLEWLIETDHQQLLPESSLPMFPDLNDTKATTMAMMDASQQHAVLAPKQDDADDEDMVETALLHNMVDPNVTMQSLFLPQDDLQ